MRRRLALLGTALAIVAMLTVLVASTAFAQTPGPVWGYGSGWGMGGYGGGWGMGPNMMGGYHGGWGGWSCW